MTLLDSNIFMYAVGREHPHKQRSAAFLKRVLDGAVTAAVDAEALQEILYRYQALGRAKQGLAVYDEVRMIVPEVIPITGDIMDRARALMERHSRLISRDAVHAAVVQVGGLTSICSFDSDFDQIPNLRRIEP